MTNFAFLPDEFRDLSQAAQKAEEHIPGDPRAACFHARFALEAAVPMPCSRVKQKSLMVSLKS